MTRCGYVFSTLAVLLAILLQATRGAADDSADHIDLLRTIALFQRAAPSSLYRSSSYFQYLGFSSRDWPLLEAQAEIFASAKRPSPRFEKELVFFHPRMYTSRDYQTDVKKLFLDSSELVIEYNNQSLQALPSRAANNPSSDFSLFVGNFRYPANTSSSTLNCAAFYVEPVQRFQGCIESVLLENQAITSYSCLDEAPLEEFSKTLDRLEMKAPHCFQEYLHMFSDYEALPSNEFPSQRRFLRGESGNPSLGPASKRAKFKRLMRMLQQQQGKQTYSIPYLQWNQTLQHLQQCEVIIESRSESYALLAQVLPPHLRKDYNMSAVLLESSFNTANRQPYMLSSSRKVEELRHQKRLRNLRGDIGEEQSSCPALMGEKRRIVERKLPLESLLFSLANERLDRQLMQEQISTQIPAITSCIAEEKSRVEVKTTNRVRLEPPVQLMASRGVSGKLAMAFFRDVLRSSIGEYWNQPMFSAASRDRNKAKNEQQSSGECRADVDILYTEAGLFRMRTSTTQNNQSRNVIDTTLFHDFGDRNCRQNTDVQSTSKYSNGDELLLNMTKGIVIIRDPFLYAYNQVFKNLAIDLESHQQLSHAQIEDTLVKALQPFNGNSPIKQDVMDINTPTSSNSATKNTKAKSVFNEKRLVGDLELQILNQRGAFSKLSLTQERELELYQQLNEMETNIYQSSFHFFFERSLFVSLFREMLKHGGIQYDKSFQFMSVEALLSASFDSFRNTLDNSSTLTSRLLMFFQKDLPPKTAAGFNCNFISMLLRPDPEAFSTVSDLLAMQKNVEDMKLFFQHYPRLLVETRAFLMAKWGLIAKWVEDKPKFLF